MRRIRNAYLRSKPCYMHNITWHGEAIRSPPALYHPPLDSPDRCRIRYAYLRPKQYYICDRNNITCTIFYSYTQVYWVIYDSGLASLEHLLLSRNPSQLTHGMKRHICGRSNIILVPYAYLRSKNIISAIEAILNVQYYMI